MSDPGPKPPKARLPAVSPATESCSGRWNPYLVGAGIGILSWMVFVLVDKPLGISTQISAAAGACVAPFVGAETVSSNAYWLKHPFQWDYSMLFLIGTFLGALASSVVGGHFKVETIPPVWRERFGSARWKRMVAAFGGGAIMMFGARLAGGCTSGHGISGSLQLALSSWTFFLTMFAFGVAAAFLLFRNRSGTT